MSTPNLIPIIEALKTVKYNGVLDMDEPRVISDERWTDDGTDGTHKCGTVHCIAGWYVVAKLQADPEHPLHDEPCVDYGAGVDMINEDIGGMSLAFWAQDNPELWGNYQGCAIWAETESWTEDGFSEIEDMTDVIWHLERVQERIDVSINS